MAPRIVAIGTAVPPVRLAQTDVRDMFTTQPGTSRLTQRLVHAAFDAADIQTRHSVVTQLSNGLCPGSTSMGTGGKFVQAETLRVLQLSSYMEVLEVELLLG